MATYTLDLEIPANTPKEKPVEKILQIKEGVITCWLILIPAGMHSLARMRVLYGLDPLLPRAEGVWLRGEDETLNVPDFFDPPEQPYRLRFQGWNEDDTYNHTFYTRVVVLLREQALAHAQFLKRLSHELSTAFMRATGYV